MKINVNSNSPVEKTIDVTLAWKEVAEEYMRVFQKLRKNLKLDGFRPGKVPEALARRLLDPQIKYEFTNEVIEHNYQDAIKESKLAATVDFQISKVDFKEGGEFLYSITVEVDPEVELPDYKKGFTVDRNVYVVDPEDVDLYLEDLKEQHAIVGEVTDGAQDGHFIAGDIQECDANGVPIVGKRIQDRMIKIGEGIFGKPGAAQLIGAKAGDQIRISVTPEKGDDVFYEIKVKRVESHTQPEFTDDYIKGNFNDVQSYTELREQVEKSLQSEWDRRADTELQRSIREYFTNNTSFEVAPSRIRSFLDGIIEDTRKRNEDKDVDEARLREMYTPLATREIRWYLIQRALIETEKIEVPAEDLEKKIEEIAGKYGEQERAQVVKFYHKRENRNRLENDIYEQKVHELLLGFAKTKKKNQKTSEMRKKEQQ